MGSKFQRLRAAWKSPEGKEIRDAARHFLEASTVERQDAANTAMVIEHLGPVLSALKDQDNAVIRIGTILIVKYSGDLVVLQLSDDQRLKLDIEPRLAKDPQKILDRLQIPAAATDMQPALTADESEPAPECEQSATTHVLHIPHAVLSRAKQTAAAHAAAGQRLRMSAERLETEPADRPDGPRTPGPQQPILSTNGLDEPGGHEPNTEPTTGAPSDL